MSLVILMGPQAVGKRTVGRLVAKKIKGKLLYNHQTLAWIIHTTIERLL